MIADLALLAFAAFNAAALAALVVDEFLTEARRPARHRRR